MSNKDYLFKGSENERLTVLVPRSIKNKLAAYVTQRGSTMSWVINHLIEEFLNNQPKKKASVKK